MLIPKKALEDWANSDMLENGSQARMAPGESDGIQIPSRERVT